MKLQHICNLVGHEWGSIDIAQYLPPEVGRVCSICHWYELAILSTSISAIIEGVVLDWRFIEFIEGAPQTFRETTSCFNFIPEDECIFCEDTNMSSTRGVCKACSVYYLVLLGPKSDTSLDTR